MSDAPRRPPLRLLADACVQQRLSVPVPDDAAAFVARKSVASRAMRTARRALLLRFSGQLPLLQTRFDPAWKRVLWVHEGMPQIGDALMDLAPRSLLVEHGVQVDLFAAPHIAALFERDAWFTRARHRPDAVSAADYDAVILLSHDRKARVLKRERLARMPWVSLQGYYDGPDFHRARFATQRLADLLGLTLTPEAFARHAAQKLMLAPEAAAQASISCPLPGMVALALGGVWPERTYRRWPALVAALHARGVSRFMLVGGGNGRSLADALTAESGAGIELLDLVGGTRLPEAQALLSRCAAVVCADGGLMHLALATTVPVVALFNAAIDPAWRVPIGMNGSALRSPTRQVDDIAPEAIARAVVAALEATMVATR